MTWTVSITERAKKRIGRLPKTIKNRLVFLMREIETHGPARGNWPNYGKLSGTRHHCHLKKGQPTYVAVWEVVNKEIKLVEVIYAGTHEKAPY
jgi:mRNA-degrading endonuclease RelE of RelBE toxin-antitoxin system